MKSHQKTKIGAVLSLLAGISILVISIFFATEVFNKTQLFVNQSKVTKTPTRNMTDFPLMIKITNASGIATDSETTNLVLQRRGINFSETGKLMSINDVIPLEKCDISKHFGQYKEYALKVFANELSTYKCLTPGVNNLFLYGTYGDTTGFIYMNIYATRCVNGTYYNTYNCKSSDEIESILENSFLNLWYLDYDIDHNNPEHPIKLVIKGETQAISTTLYKRYFSYKRVGEYTTDYGLVYEDKETLNFHYQDAVTVNADLRKGGVVPGVYGEYSITLANKVETYYRSYTKLQTLLANIGGVMKSILFLAQIIMYFFSEKLYFAAFFNNLIDQNVEVVKNKIDNNNLIFPITNNMQISTNPIPNNTNTNNNLNLNPIPYNNLHPSTMINENSGIHL